MKLRCTALLMICCACASAVIVDRIAIVCQKKIVKDSDIVNDLKITAFLNQEPLNATLEARKRCANRLVEQIFIAAEVEAGSYRIATLAEAQETLNSVVKSRYATEDAYRKALGAYGISEEELKARLLWQLTVLRFIDARFRSAAYVTDEEIEKYFEVRKEQFKGDLNASRAKIEEILSGERTNKEFYDWLDRRRQGTPIRYLEESLK
jgi:hypothetical protein